MGIGWSQVVILFFAVVFPIGISFYLNNKFRKRNPNSCPYRWGFFIAAIIGLVYPLIIFTTLVFSLYNSQLSNLPTLNTGALFILTAILTTLGWYIFKRYKWPWIVILIPYTISLSFYLISTDFSRAFVLSTVLLLNIRYVYNRWQELKPIKTNDPKDIKSIVD